MQLQRWGSVTIGSNPHAVCSMERKVIEGRPYNEMVDIFSCGVLLQLGVSPVFSYSYQVELLKDCSQKDSLTLVQEEVH